MDFKVLWQGNFAKVISPKEHPYESFHEGNGVIVIPIIDGKIGIRQEFCPSYLVKNKTSEKLYYTLITGMIDEEDLTPMHAALRELKEETGIVVKDYFPLYAIEDIPEAKSNTRHIGLYVLHIKDFDKIKIEGDGTEYEAKSKTVWVSPSRLTYIVTHKKNIDFLLVSAYFILKEISSDNFLWVW